MTDKIDDGGAAFPNGRGRVYDNDAQGFVENNGMSLRDYFAAQALMGALTTVKGPGFCDWNYYAEAAYHLADAMLAARKDKP